MSTCTPADGSSSTRIFLTNASDNTCEINLMDIAEKKDVRPDLIDKVDIKDADNLTGKYVSKARKMVSKTFAKRALQ
jgi:hypothetical protein